MLKANFCNLSQPKHVATSLGNACSNAVVFNRGLLLLFMLAWVRARKLDASVHCAFKPQTHLRQYRVGVNVVK